MASTPELNYQIIELLYRRVVDRLSATLRRVPDWGPTGKLEGRATFDVGFSATHTLTSTQWSKRVIDPTGTPVGTLSLIFPTIDGAWWIVRNSLSGGSPVEVQTAGGTPLVIAAGDTQIVFCDGTNIVAAAPDEP